jgi:hypothetical protein
MRRRSKRVRHKDRQAERMIKKNYSIEYIAKKTGKPRDWLELIE